MKTSNKEKFIHEVDTTGSVFTSSEPFTVQKQDKRSFVRVEISAPATISPLKDSKGKLTSEIAEVAINGVILNLSVSGILIDLDGALTEDDVVSMRFTLQGGVTLDNILGLVKRCEPDAEGMIVGIEFLTEQRLSDLFSAAEVDLLGERFTNFNAGLSTLLSKFVHSKAAPDSGNQYHAAP